MKREHKFLYPLGHKKANFGCRCGSSVGYLPTTCETLGSIPSITNNNNRLTT